MICYGYKFTSDLGIKGDGGGEGRRGDMVITNGIEVGSPVVSLVFEGRIEY